MFHVIIVEDDPMVASINRQYLETDPEMRIDGTFSNGRDALDYLKTHPVDLAVVDLYMPLMNGMEFIRKCRDLEIRTLLVMITAANTADDITAALSLGVLDYIVKPFTYERFRETLEKFRRVRKMMGSGTRLTQAEVDQLMRQTPLPEKKKAEPVKGIQPQTLDLLRSHLSEHTAEYLTSDEISKSIGLSRITVRRYLNYLLENGEITSMVDYTTGGRPSLRYRIRR
ncbi:MAG: response regulator [Lachnospiraceae bacterium]|nr:response regulator [Lachnospiraceae bacterium]